MINEIWKAKIDSEGLFILDENGNKEMELVSSENVTITYTLDELNKMQYDELQKTDWYFTRKVELNIDVPNDIINERLAIREKYDLLKLEL